MDYASTHIINSTPQDTSSRKLTVTNELDHSSFDQHSIDETMVTQETGQTVVVGVHLHHEDADDSDMEHKTDHNLLSDSVKNETTIETKIKLNFSVDRLLGADFEDGRIDRNQRIVISTNFNNNNNNNNNCNGLNQGQFECCKFVANVNHSQLGNFHLQKQQNTVSQRSHPERGILLPPSMDINSVVRPTPIRAMGNGQDEGLSYSSMASSILKFHQHHHQHQVPTASISALSSLMAPFNSLKSMQINQQHFRQSANIQSVSKSLDIPPTTLSNGSNSSGPSGSTVSSVSITNSGKRKRSWSRAVFSNLQRKGLEIQFQQQKYITKPDRRKLAARLNLTDAQVKVWFQNRRMKWRHTRENLKSGQEKPVTQGATSTTSSGADNLSSDKKCYTSSSDSDEDEIDVVE